MLIKKIPYMTNICFDHRVDVDIDGYYSLDLLHVHNDVVSARRESLYLRLYNELNSDKRYEFNSSRSFIAYKKILLFTECLSEDMLEDNWQVRYNPYTDQSVEIFQPENRMRLNVILEESENEENFEEAYLCYSKNGKRYATNNTLQNIIRFITQDFTYASSLS